MDRNAFAAFARFVICGGGVGLLSSGTLMLLTGSMSIAVANAIVTVVSTLVCNELHSRITFRKGAASIRAHLESSGTAVVAYLFTTTAMLVLEAVAPHAGALTQQVVYLSASALAGLGRFVVLRMVVFARKTDAADPVNVIGAIGATAYAAYSGYAAEKNTKTSTKTSIKTGTKTGTKRRPVVVGTLIPGAGHATVLARERLAAAA